MNENDIDILFTYHNPSNISPERFESIRHAAKNLGKIILLSGGKNADLYTSIDRLRECVFYAIASIVVPKISSDENKNG